MDQLINTFYLDGKLIIAQIINFIIVVLILSFGLKPILKAMRERTDKIEKSLMDAKKIEENLSKTEEEKEKKLDEAQQNAIKILEEAKKIANNNKETTLEKTKKEVSGIINKAKEQLSEEKEQMLKEVKAEACQLITTALTKILEQNISQKFDQAMIKRALKDIEEK